MRIINGEIVKDDDPRLKQRPQSSSAGGSNSSNYSNSSSRLRDVNSIPPPDAASTSPQQPHSNPLDNPLQVLARNLKIDGLFITLPAVPRMGINTPTNVGLIYMLLAGVLYLIFDYKALVFAVIMFFIYKNSYQE